MMEPHEHKTQAGAAQHLWPAALEVRAIMKFARRRARMIGFAGGLAMTPVVAYLAFAPAEYTASALVMVEPRRANVPGSDSMLAEATGAAFVDSRVEVLRSDRIPLALHQKGLLQGLDLSGQAGLTGAMLAALGLADTQASPEDELRATLETFRARLDVRRIAGTQMLQISFRWTDRHKAAEIANALADSFINDQLESKHQSDRKTAQWLEARITSVRKQAQDAEAQAQAFRAQAELVGSGSGLLVEQQMQEVSSQLIALRAHASELQERLVWIERAQGGDFMQAASTGVLNDERIADLQRQLVATSRRASEIVEKVGDWHPAVSILQNQMQQIESEARSQLQRLAIVGRNDHAIAQARVVALEASLSDLVERIKSANQDRAVLVDLESGARVHRALHDRLLERLASISQQQAYPVAEGQVVSPASAPIRKSGPRSLFLLAASLLMGLGAGAAAGYIRDQLDAQP